MTKLAWPFCAITLWGATGQTSQTKTPDTMTRMVVRLMGPTISAGSFSALPKTIYRAGDRYARIEDPPDAKQHVQKLTIIAGVNAYSANLIDKRGTHATEKTGGDVHHLPIVQPLDPRHKLGKLDGIEFGDELEFFGDAGAAKQPGPVINAKPTDQYSLGPSDGAAVLVVRSGTDTPVTLSWRTDDGTYKYEYIEYEDIPFQPALFTKPPGIHWRELPSDDGSSAPNR